MENKDNKEEGLSPSKDQDAVNIEKHNTFRAIEKKLPIPLPRIWHQKPIEQPTVDHNLSSLPAHERTSEVIRYKVLQLEYALSPDGFLRGWIKLWIFLCLIMAIPLVLFFLISPLITSFTGSLLTWSEYFQQALGNILIALLYLIAIVIIIGICLGAIIAWKRKRHLKRRVIYQDSKRNDRY